MASTEEQLCRKSGETAGHLASLNGTPDFGCTEDLREFRDSLEEVDAVIKSRGQPAIMGTAGEYILHIDQTLSVRVRPAYIPRRRDLCIDQLYVL
jgi:hypothetical protein